MQTDNKYNGYSNRSTWLASLWLNNHNEDTYKKALVIAKRYKEMKEYHRKLIARDPQSYSYPFHQHNGIERDLRSLIQSTPITTEADYGISNVNITEVLESII
jgi:hypothetical protein